MGRKLLCHVLIFGVATLCGGLAPDTLAAQDPAKPRPTPAPIPTAEPIAIPPQTKLPRPNAQEIDPRALLPDLEPSLRPRSSSAAPNEFIIENSGVGDAMNASLLRVNVRLLPLDNEGRAALFGTFGLLAGLGASPEQIEEGIDQRFAELCTLPYPNFQAAIDPLDAGESQVVSQAGSRIGGDIRDVGLVAARPTTRVQAHSYVRQIEVRLVCLYEVRATVDANAEVAESNERNNELIHTFLREVTLR